MSSFRASMPPTTDDAVTWGFTVGKHVAREGTSADPIVAEALARRPATAVHHAAAEGPVGWPGEPAPEGGGLGWPADVGAADSAPEEPAPPVARRGWRRLLGSSRAA
jgi:hypothetical protein